MKRMLFYIGVLVVMQASAQPNGDPSQYLAQDDAFIDLVQTSVGNGLQVSAALQGQLGDKLPDFKIQMAVAETEESFAQTIAEYGLDRELIDQKLSEQVAYGMIFKQKHNWFWYLEPIRQAEIIRNAVGIGMNSQDPRWQKILPLLQTGEGTQSRVDVNTIGRCVLETLMETIRVVAIVSAVIDAVREGDFVDLVIQIKKLLKQSGRRFGWFGLAMAAADIALCIFNHA